jgi:hypothetical protein
MTVDPEATLKRSQLRLSYRPDRVRLLFIGEAPPASGKFFYQADSGLYRAVRDAFQLIDPSVTGANFLSIFRAAGCYLIDLCGRPVDQLDRAARHTVCREGEPSLCRILQELQPERIATVVRSIRGNVERAVSCAGWKGDFLDLPYPGRWWRHKEIFLAQLAPVLRSLTHSATH